ncbi:MAG TPA: hypothetical protein P5205_03925 [Candidatus Paceibacterota bacterium]|nr:hypothetical protein [Verrucomicrobiota bacterium]HSA09497.1 hypothetical protein [Candidatus Paceibacterota bacterium]
MRMAIGVSVLALCAGCSGVNHTHSVSPASILIPGLLQADPPPAHPDLVLPTQGTLPSEADQA